MLRPPCHVARVFDLTEHNFIGKNSVVNVFVEMGFIESRIKLLRNFCATPPHSQQFASLI
jgi:hypothetical protein